MRWALRCSSQEQETADTARALARSAILHMGIWGRRAKQWKPGIFVHTGRISCSAMLRESPALYHLMVVEDLVKPFPITADSEIGEEIS